jgi:predicted DsbA family dithiol-disulfide isomerase
MEIWSDVVCPWCYLGKRRFERALGSFGHRGDVEVVYRSFELDPSADPRVTTHTAGLLANKYGMSLAQATAAQQQMAHRAAADRLDFADGQPCAAATPAARTGCCR